MHRVRELPSENARLESTRKLATGEKVRLAYAMVLSISRILYGSERLDNAKDQLP